GSNQAKGPLGIAVVEHRNMVGKRRKPRESGSDRRPIGPEMKFPVGMGEAVEKMAGRERRAASEPTVFREMLEIGQPAHPQGPVDQPQGTHGKTRVVCAEALGELADHVMVRAAFAMRRQYRAPELQIGGSPAR